VLRLCIITGRQCKDNMSFSTIEFQPQYVVPVACLVLCSHYTQTLLGRSIHAMICGAGREDI